MTESHKENIRKYKEKNIDKIKAYQKEYREKNKERIALSRELLKEKRGIKTKPKVVEVETKVKHKTKSIKFNIGFDTKPNLEGLVYANESSMDELLKYIDISNPLNLKDIQITIMNTVPENIFEKYGRIMRGELKLIIRYDENGFMTSLKGAFLLGDNLKDSIFAMRMFNNKKELTSIHINYITQDNDLEDNTYNFQHIDKEVVRLLILKEIEYIFKDGMMCRLFHMPTKLEINKRYTDNSSLNPRNFI